jgi:hypothetical protein
MPEIPADLPDPACLCLHFESGIEENQSLAPDRLAPARPHTRATQRGASLRGIPAIRGAGRAASPIQSGASSRCGPGGRTARACWR